MCKNLVFIECLGWSKGLKMCVMETGLSGDFPQRFVLTFHLA